MRLALFGGSFDPVHLGHLHVADCARRHFGFDLIHFLPALIPPHKQDRVLLPIAQRLELLRAALADEPRCRIEESEIRSGGNSYTLDTLTRLQSALPLHARLFFLIGGDSLVDLPAWYRAGELIRRFTLVTVPRESGQSPADLLKPLQGAFSREDLDRLERHILPVTPLPISSTDIRERIRQGLPIEDLVPAAVSRLIREKGYYSAGSAG
ncbi:MAG: nicotinate (nicotinamide) nucleotide adenylyltransferase [Planctomycetota bacterium]